MSATPPPKRYTKSTLPTKVCATCGRPFAWRKKWSRCWDEVKYCGEKCQRQRGGTNASSVATGPAR